MYVKRNIEMRSCNDCESGKAISITYSECVTVVLGIQHAVQCQLSSAPSTIFSHVSHKWHNFRKKLFSTKCVF